MHAGSKAAKRLMQRVLLGKHGLACLRHDVAMLRGKRPSAVLTLCGREAPPSPGVVEATSAITSHALARQHRLNTLIKLRKLYRNLLRADGLLAQASPVYCPRTATNGEISGQWTVRGWE